MSRYLKDDQIRKALNDEMEAVRLSEEQMERVIKRAQHVPWWEIELRIPWSAAAAALLLIAAIPIAGWLHLDRFEGEPSVLAQREKGQDSLIAMGGGLYLESELLEGWNDSDD
ncbi:hypothetical protein [Paenibacillus radicis (ex Gao et al. 2016)]|uniref:DUF3619 family protein n=1 Tax=Paenibacillus radicis (ex Gao et al. 2016) TaxID=1737354 RepID=A0A917M8R7_9BACL|nr:hypothetical protein [Paenibacillus radicis (ex Gao et al. 2016)]GGG84827.1 hypothetical protein GCM10010918_48390 [Paenibacillus radicis (ex Gao et al. 2016)]